MGRQMSWGDSCPGGTLVQGDKCRGDTCLGGHLSRGTNVLGGHLSWGDTCPGGQMSWGDSCPGGTLVQGDKCRGDNCPGGHLSRGTNVGGTLVRGTNVTTPSSQLVCIVWNESLVLDTYYELGLFFISIRLSLQDKSKTIQCSMAASRLQDNCKTTSNFLSTY